MLVPLPLTLGLRVAKGVRAARCKSSHLADTKCITLHEPLILCVQITSNFCANIIVGPQVPLKKCASRQIKRRVNTIRHVDQVFNKYLCLGSR